MVTNPFGVEAGEYYKYHRPGWTFASIVKIEDDPHDVYGMQVRDVEGSMLGYRPTKLSDFPADGIFEIIRLKPEFRGV